LDNLIGQSLGRYYILERLGEGGMATVYRAFDTRLECDVAIKIISTVKFSPETMERALKRFDREAKALARLTHPNIVKVTDYGECEGRPYLVMPYLPGGNLKEFLKQHGQLNWQEAVKIILPIAHALQHAHEQNVIHRDVKPSNILITQSGDPMLTDFGVAKILEEEATMDLTGASMSVGTPEYMAPEQADVLNTDRRTDIYSLGVVLYEMVTGRRPFEADTPMAVMIMQARDPLPSPRRFSVALPDAVERIQIKALAKQPGDRYQDMQAFSNALEIFLIKSSKGPAKIPLAVRTDTHTASTPALAQETDRPTRSAWTKYGLPAGAIIIILAIAFGLTIPGSGLGRWIQPLIPQAGLKTTPSSTATSLPLTIMQVLIAALTPTKEPPTLTYKNDFNNGDMSGLRSMSGEWSIVSENSTNNALQVTETQGTNWPSIGFGPITFRNGIIQYRFNFAKVNSDSIGMEYIFFRQNWNSTGDSYTFQIQILNHLADLNYVPSMNGSWPSLANRPVNLSQGEWHTVRVEVKDWQFTIHLDGQFFLLGEDTDQHINTGKLALQGSPNTTIWFDDLQVWQPAQ
jgi:serine/threonine protein kinase